MGRIKEAITDLRFRGTLVGLSTHEARREVRNTVIKVTPSRVLFDTALNHALTGDVERAAAYLLITDSTKINRHRKVGVLTTALDSAASANQRLSDNLWDQGSVLPRLVSFTAGGQSTRLFAKSGKIEKRFGKK